MDQLLDELADHARGSVTDVIGTAEGVELRGVTHDSRDVGRDTLFACVRGTAFDGHDYAAQAVADGAVALLVDHPLGGIAEVPQIVVDDTRRRLGPISAAVYGHPSRDLATVGITGTNGKTTTAQLLAAIFEEHGWQTGIVGTLHGERTTPEAPELQALLASFKDVRVRRGRHGGVVARPGAPSGRRNTVRRRRVHQSRPGPPRSARFDRGVLPGQGPTLRPGVLAAGRLLADRSTTPSPIARSSRRSAFPGRASRPPARSAWPKDRPTTQCAS